MFSYCGGNPIARADEHGKSWALILGTAVILTLFDIGQLAGIGEEAISSAYTANNKSVRIENSNHIITPWMQYGYSLYLNHFSEYKDYFTGSTIGMTYEWFLHNCGSAGFYVAGRAMNAVGMDGTKMLEFSERCNDVDLGPTIYHDDASTKGVFSHIMKATFFFLYPDSATHDYAVYNLE